jgi:hypothetical protein
MINGTARARRYILSSADGSTSRQEGGEERTFPKHETTEISYPLGADHTAFHEAGLDYCLGVVEKAGTGKRDRSLAF